MSTLEHAERHPGSLRKQETERTMELAAGGSALEALGGIGAVVLAIVGLSGVLPLYMTAIAVIVIGAALLSEGGSLAARFSKLLSESEAGSLGATEIGGGVTVEFLGGAAGIVLGVLSLLGVVPWVLLPVSAVVFGGALLLGAGTTARLNRLAEKFNPEHASLVARESLMAATGSQVMIGLAGVILGILALVGLDPVVLTLVAMLSLAAAVLLTGSAVSSRMLSAFQS